jgi:hypothetical protein
MPNERDREKLRELILLSSKSIKRLEAYRGLIFPPEIDSKVVSAIDDCAISIRKMADTVEKLWDENGLKQPWSELGPPNFERFLERHGLTGPQLDFKVASIRSLRRKLDREFTFGRLKNFLKAIRIPLESLGEGVPGFGFVKELFDLFETWIDESEGKD